MGGSWREVNHGAGQASCILVLVLVRRELDARQPMAQPAAFQVLGKEELGRGGAGAVSANGQVEG